ncbi:MAG: 3-hydroxy-3-methylglutaryl-CoA reductase, partial [Chloroflexota bacterium]|nr:3-hydroxy-3-methylglutaryl-CoA reductase [Chloroflexota bacterium]
ALARWCEDHVEDIARQLKMSTSHGGLCQMVTHIAGRRLFVEFRITTGEAMGSNMCSNAAEMMCQWIAEQGPDAKDSYICVTPNDKKPDNISSMTGKGKTVVAEAVIPESVLERVLHTDGKRLVNTFESVEEWWTLSGARGHNGAVANQLAALYIACGQDVAYVAEACAGHTNVSPGREGGVHVTVILPSVIVGTVGAGSALPTSKECLRILGCEGAESARKLAEIAAASALAGELSALAALAAGEFVRAHNQLGRNRPEVIQTEQLSIMTHA